MCDKPRDKPPQNESFTQREQHEIRVSRVLGRPDPVFMICSRTTVQTEPGTGSQTVLGYQIHLDT